MAEDELEIIVRVNPTWMQLTQKVIAIASATVIPIGIGVALDSPAMQWLGFVFSILSVLGLTYTKKNDNTHKTFVEAIMWLEIEAMQRGLPSPMGQLKPGAHVRTMAAEELAARGK
jgi:hypothetical protein